MLFLRSFLTKEDGKMTENANHFLATEKISTLMVKFSIPCIISLLVSALYNIVDQIFIGQGVGYLGNGATNVVFPITVVALAVSLLLGDGYAAYFSICQGKNDQENVHRCIGNCVTLLVLSGIFLMLVFFIFDKQIMQMFGATENNLPFVIEYYYIIVLGIPFYVLSNGLAVIIRADGSPQFAMLAIFVGCIINIILDPIAIFILEWGVTGAAIATIIGQVVSTIILLKYLSHTKSSKLQKESFFIKKSVLKKAIPLGISSFLIQIAIVILIGVMNLTLIKYGALSKYGPDIPMTVMGIVMKIFQIVIALCIGIAAGCQPIVGYNFGAKKYDRVKLLFKYMMIVETLIGVVATIFFMLYPVEIISLFGSESALYNEFAVQVFHIFLSTILLSILVKAIGVFLQSLGYAGMALSLIAFRDFIFSVSLILLLGKAMGVIGPLYSGPIADILSSIIAFIMIAKVYKTLNVQSNVSTIPV